MLVAPLENSIHDLNQPAGIKKTFRKVEWRRRLSLKVGTRAQEGNSSGRPIRQATTHSMHGRNASMFINARFALNQLQQIWASSTQCTLFVLSNIGVLWKYSQYITQAIQPRVEAGFIPGTAVTIRPHPEYTHACGNDAGNDSIQTTHAKKKEHRVFGGVSFC